MHLGNASGQQVLLHRYNTWRLVQMAHFLPLVVKTIDWSRFGMKTSIVSNLQTQNIFVGNNVIFSDFLSSRSTDGPVELEYGFVYIAHPRAVTHISWRTTSKYMPK